MKPAIAVHKDQLRSPKAGLLLFCAAFILFVALFILGRFVLVHRIVEAHLVLRALLVDLAMGVCIAVLAKALQALHWAVSGALLLLVSVLHIANMELAAAMDTFITFTDLRFAMQEEFLRGSLQVSFPWYTIALLLGSAFYLAAMSRIDKRGPIRPRYLLIGAAACLFGAHLLTSGEAGWSSSNTIWLSVTRSIGALIPSSRVAPWPERPRPAASEAGGPNFRKAADSRRNVLFVVLEGIPGVYLGQVQEWTGVKYPIEMPALSRIAERAVVIPNFVNHNRQTIRGLYSLLSGDYCRLSLATPKIYEYMQIDPASRRPCLPEILAQKGYTTAYLQAAELAYMSKDRFMPEAGFQQVLGKEYFRYQHVPFGWGPDDKAFFEQAAEFIGELDRGPNPWFVTLLTVGTHHPGAVPEQFAARFGSRKEAAAAYLDQALADFMERLEGQGILMNTLVLLTSDESHGVTGQPYGRFWGLAVLRAPEAFGAINPGVFGLIDIPYSILDYLGFVGRTERFDRQSIFRRYATERAILFESYFSERKGVVQQLLDGGRVEILSSSNGELYSRDYSRQTLSGEEGRRLSRQLARLQAAADSSLFDSRRKDRLYVLLENDDFALGRKQSRVLSTGQYLEIPRGTMATVELHAAVEPAGGSGEAPERDCLHLILLMMREGEKMPLPELRLPVLKEGQTLELSFSFHATEPMTRIWAFLQAEAVHPFRGVLLKVERLSVETRKRKAGHPFQINRLIVKSDHQVPVRLENMSSDSP